MRMVCDYSNYDYVSCDVIRKFLKGENRAFEIVVKRYSNYLHRCFVGLAPKYRIKPCELPLDDLKQEAWLRYENIVRLKFQL